MIKYISNIIVTKVHYNDNYGISDVVCFVVITSINNGLLYIKCVLCLRYLKIYDLCLGFVISKCLDMVMIFYCYVLKITRFLLILLLNNYYAYLYILIVLQYSVNPIHMA